MKARSFLFNAFEPLQLKIEWPRAHYFLTSSECNECSITGLHLLVLSNSIRLYLLAEGLCILKLK